MKPIVHICQCNVSSSSKDILTVRKHCLGAVLLFFVFSGESYATEVHNIPLLYSTISSTVIFYHEDLKSTPCCNLFLTEPQS